VVLPPPPQIVALGVDTYLKMLLQDNFVHTDLVRACTARLAGGGGWAGMGCAVCLAGWG
jgi:aarF domain-containing kinase